ncbi:hypothetical protein V5O48_015367 [Marasmius crinis-equi]|uniref:ubiquitinyl hydrolase 1 n=1 Tax=Marasmius crinis-equi TaxID=585013 RepID=A0ABR3EUR0_9AGAR
MSHEGILKPPQIIVFTLRKGGAASASSSLDTFVYPKTLYMDQFLLENFQIVNAKRTREAEIRSLLIQLDQRKAELTTHDNRDAIKDLKTSLQYFENVAHVGDSPDRRASVASTAEKLRKVLLGLETAVEKINAEVEKLQNEIKSLFECPELQNHRYDLRVVLMHTGVSGRKQMYSYVQDRNGAWWKTLDHAVTEVTEVDVLTDPTGIHLGAGPYMLIYSRHVPQEQLLQPIQWPRQFVDTTNNNNEHFLKTLSPEMADKFRMAKGNGSEEPRIEDAGQSGNKRVTLSEGGKGSQDVSMMDLNAGN